MKVYFTTTNHNTDPTHIFWMKHACYARLKRLYGATGLLPYLEQVVLNGLVMKNKINGTRFLFYNHTNEIQDESI